MRVLGWFENSMSQTISPILILFVVTYLAHALKVENEFIAKCFMTVSPPNSDEKA